MNDIIKEILDDCGCNDYDLCLEFLKLCFPNIDCVTQDDYYLMGRDAFIRLARDCLEDKIKNKD